jgi:hypothetical protein
MPTRRRTLLPVVTAGPAGPALAEPSPTHGTALWAAMVSDRCVRRTTFDRVIADTPRDRIASRATDAKLQWNIDPTPSFPSDGKLYEGAMLADTFSQILGS